MAALEYGTYEGVMYYIEDVGQGWISGYCACVIMIKGVAAVVLYRVFGKNMTM